MPKVIVYVRADDARAIEMFESKPVAIWVREQVAASIKRWRRERSATAVSVVDREDRETFD